MKRQHSKCLFISLWAFFISGLLLKKTVFAAELSVEAEIDNTPAELRQLSVKANALEARIRELERRIVETQNVVVGSTQTEQVDFRLNLVPGSIERSSSDKSAESVVSHLRMSLNGRSFLYNQSAVIVSDKNPLPLFIGKIPQGQYQLRIQFQTAQLGGEIMSLSRAPWTTIDRVFNLDINPAAGKQQSLSLAIHESEKDVNSRLPLSHNDNSVVPIQMRSLEKPVEAR